MAMNRPPDRREFLRWSAASLTAAGLWGMPTFLRRALAQPMLPNKKLLFIFLRGGMDAVQAAIPFGDAGAGSSKPTYLQARPTIGVQPALAPDLNGFCHVHPAMQDAAPDGPKVADIFHDNVDGRGRHLAIIHRVGYEGQNRSHFSSQQFWENGDPRNVKLEKGVLNNYLTVYPDASNPLRAATVDRNQMVMLKGDSLVPVLSSIDAYALPRNVLLGSFPTSQFPFGSGLMGAYGQSPPNPDSEYCSLTYGTGSTLLESLQFFEDNVRNTPYAPEPDAQPFYNAIGNNRFRGFVRDCARILKQVDGAQIVGCNQGGYDTHGAEIRRFPPLVRDLGLALTALYHDLGPIWNDVVVMTASEFSRTSRENGNDGTDHGEASCMFVMGGPVRGRVYNCDSSTWANGDLFSSRDRYVAHRTDYRNVYNEIITDHLGDPQGKINQIIPGYDALAAADTNGYFTPLNFIV